MQKSLGMFLALATLSGAYAQTPDPASPYSSLNSQAAPIVRAAPDREAPAQSLQMFDSQPAAGIMVRGDVHGGVQTVTSSSSVTELRISQGRADVTVHHPTDHSEILVDLPGGQVALLKDGLYTFNAETDTVRVLQGEAKAYTGKNDEEKGVKVKEAQQLAFFNNAKLKAVDAYPYELTADLIGRDRHGDSGYLEDGGYGRDYDFGYPGYAGVFGYPGFYPYNYYGYGYPFGVGVGFGYYRGFGGFRGGFRR